RQRRATAPAADQFRCEQFPLFLGAAVVAQKSIESADTRLIFAEAHIGAVAAEDVRPRHRQGDPSLTWISKNELTGPDWPCLARKRVDAPSFDRRLVHPLPACQP